jgi:hypothetical protein
MTTFDLNLPSGLPVKFRAPNFIDRRNILKEFDKNGGYTSEDLLAVKCLQQVKGKEFDANAYYVTDPIEVLHDWSLNDYMYYLEVFLSMFMIDEEARKEANNVAKKLLKGESITTTEKNAPATLNRPSKLSE